MKLLKMLVKIGLLAIFCVSLVGCSRSPALMINPASKILVQSQTGAQPFVAKINRLTIQVIQLNLTEGSTLNYTGGLLMHEHGFIYAVSQSVLYKIDSESMQIVKSLNLPMVGIILSLSIGQPIMGCRFWHRGSLS